MYRGRGGNAKDLGGLKGAPARMRPIGCCTVDALPRTREKATRTGLFTASNDRMIFIRSFEAWRVHDAEHAVWSAPIRDDVGVAGFRLGRGYAHRHDDLRRPAEGHDPATRAGARIDERWQVRGPGSPARCAAGLRRARHHAVAPRCGLATACCRPPSSRRRPWRRNRLAATPPCGRTGRRSPAAGPLRRIVGDGGPIERPIRAAKAVHLPQHADAKHPARLVTAEPRAAPIAQVSSDEPTAATDDGLLPKVMSTARGAWAVTASASDALLAHVIPQIP